MFDSVQLAPPDAILGLIEAFRNDPNPDKISLSVGVYQAADGKTPVQNVVQEAERRLVDSGEARTYLPIPGSPAYAKCVQRLLFGEGHTVITANRAITIHTPGGTGSLRIAADFIKSNFSGATVWLSEPTWPNHPNIFAAAGVPMKTYSYFDAASSKLNFDAMKQSLAAIPSGDVVLLHGCCHNPTGVDPTPDQWRELAALIRDRGLLPLIDFAYQGFAEGIEEDAFSIRTFAESGDELIVCSSFSKNFGLYRERVGAMAVVSADEKTSAAVFSQVKRCVRANYSNPPAHGGAIVATVLGDPRLREHWIKEVAAMRERINGTRAQLAEKLRELNVPGDYTFLAKQRGMFSSTGITPGQVNALREKYSIYIVGSGRINVAGVNDNNIDRLCAAIKDVIGS